jgi:3-methyladenine DNA glycosylase AlkD
MTQQANLNVLDNILDSIRRELVDKSDPKTKESGQRFFKEQVKLYGVKTGIVSKISKEYFGLLEGNSKREIFDLCEVLWQSGYLEESFIACNWSYALRKQYAPEDFRVFERWLSLYVNNWASCDTLCNHTIGTIVEKYPEFLNKLINWTKSDNRWVRRGAAVSLIIPARKGMFLDEILNIADKLMLDKEDLVQKGYGWMLKAASESHQKEIFDYVMENKSIMPRTAFRYAIEKMPKELKTKAMQK